MVQLSTHQSVGGVSRAGVLALNEMAIVGLALPVLPGNGLQDLLANRVLVTGFCAWFAAQFGKVREGAWWRTGIGSKFKFVLDDIHYRASLVTQLNTTHCTLTAHMMHAMPTDLHMALQEGCVECKSYGAAWWHAILPFVFMCGKPRESVG